ncbi:site-specific integrase [Tissierella creatinophila]|uniref:Uncharacterized protein n=1 Tax=Tissierella creatinophila DSM 6911 TaxID=1123403 RepID=A0A1U7M558_TISCR|nr:hypothetical protein [Tissierella creatinophila]OLS02390.1 hypothetical protein TICRE_16310 [Tissierella creatinophila DSM 6911]
MVSVDPIRDPKKIDSVKIYLKENNIRDYTMFVVGINVALRELILKNILNYIDIKF